MADEKISALASGAPALGDDEFVIARAAANNFKLTTEEVLAYGYVLLQDQKASGSNGGTFTSGSWQTRVLNTEAFDADGLCTLAANQFTLAAGTYRAVARAPGFSVEWHKLKIRNVTDSTDLLIGSNAYCTAFGSGPAETDSFVRGQFTVGASKALELQHQCNVTAATNGLGVACSFSVVEVYAEVELWKIG